ncbi:hypothetical protein MMC24_004891 [Lignoscripta atroalba]|nr:hypothetical protein [Lignoscripta atroalba]
MPEPTVIAEMTEFENQRKKNIEANEAILRGLGIENARTDVVPNCSAKKRKDRRLLAASATPTRKSARLSNKKGGADLPQNQTRKNLVRSGKVTPNKALTAAKYFGHPTAVPVGTVFKDRKDLHDKGVHRGLVAGIFGNPDVGAYSVVISGGYEDDVDIAKDGSSFTFTGEGGRLVTHKGKGAPNSKPGPQGKAQALTRGNAALVTSCMTGKPVRVVRGSKNGTDISPKEGYRYDGLYRVIKVSEQCGKSGFGIFRFEFERLSKQLPIPGAIVNTYHSSMSNASSDETER